ncbi:hypothetical protein [Phaeovulum sp. NW3]|uniref:hypothetical protein n=1 Tax=Phaeovulum sp. NW3 TaxID=2934933 RepID=UPI0020203E59|nr:hypothetical protein [Phaeovulum sp. NW3]MCL7465751.1 hypothetical protein [Phaeovulum sp. NW3]
MPLPHFLTLIALATCGAALTVWLAAGAGVPLPLLALIALLGAGLVRLMMRAQ